MSDVLSTLQQPGDANSEPWLVILGWGCPVDAVPPLHLPGPATLCGVDDPFTFVDCFASWQRQTGLKRFHLCGWSLGAHLALELAKQHAPSVVSLVLCSLRPSFPADEIEVQRASLERDPAAHLQNFFRRVFAGQGAAWRAFSAQQLPALVQHAELESLLRGLTYLQTCRVIADDLVQTQARLVHGRRDLIAPLAELEALVPLESAANVTRFSSAGHALWWSTEWAALWQK